MKRKTVLSAWILVLCLLASLPLSACRSRGDRPGATTAPPGTEETTAYPRTEDWLFTADNLADAQDIYDSFFFMTIYEENMIVTVSNDDGVYLTETIDGEKDRVEYAWDEEYFTYKDGDDFIFAVADGDNRYYFVDEEKYDENSLAVAFFLDVLSDLPDEGVTISLASEGTSTFSEYDVSIDATLTLEIVNGDATTNVTAVKESDKVVSFRCVYTDPDGSYAVEVTFSFGDASVTTPDLTGWFNASAPRTESEWYVTGTVGGQHVDRIPMYYDCISGEYKTDYVDVIVGDEFSIKNARTDTVACSETIDEAILAGHEMIVFDPEDETVSFEIGAEFFDPEN